MPTPDSADELFLDWIRGWALARELAPPLPHADGLRIEVGAPRQVRRYVFPQPSPALAGLGETVHEPWVVLKTRATPDELRALLPARWRIEPLHWLMDCGDRAFPGPRALPPGYALRVDDAVARTGCAHVDVLAPDATPAASGHVVMAGRHAVYDRIGTEPDHRRRGLARAVMQALQALAHAHGRHAGALVATDDGRALYESLGWRLRSPWAGAVIPGPDEAA